MKKSAHHLNTTAQERNRFVVYFFPHAQHGIKAGEIAIDHLTNEETWRRPAFKTIDPRYHKNKKSPEEVNKVPTPASVKKLATKGVGVGKEVRCRFILQEVDKRYVFCQGPCMPLHKRRSEDIA